MSYYTYFPLKKDSKYKDTTLEEVKKHTNVDRVYGIEWRFEDRDFILIKGEMIKAYYEESSNKKLDIIQKAVKSYVWMSLVDSDYQYLESMLSDKSEPVLWKNHCPDEYEMQRSIDDFSNDVLRIIDRLFVLSCVVYKPEYKEYCEDADSEYNYLRYNYIDEISQELDLLNEYINDYSFAKFVLENCDRYDEDVWADHRAEYGIVLNEND